MPSFLKTLVLDALLLGGVAFGHDLTKRQSCEAPDVNTGANGTRYAPIPDFAIERQVGPEGYLLEEFGNGVYMVTDGTHQAMFLAGDKGVIVVDAPSVMGVKLRYAIGNVTDLPVKKFVYSHGHADHVAGASLFADGDVEFIGHEATATFLEEMDDPNRPIPKTTFKRDLTVKLGNQTLELSYKGPNHQSGNIFIYEPTRKVLMLVDVIFPKWVPFYQLVVSEDVYGFFDAHDQVLEYDFDFFLGGHITRSGTREDVLLQKEYLRDVFLTCRNVTFGGLDVTPDVITALTLNPGNIWAAARRSYAARAEVCARETNARWIGRLGGVDVFGYDHAIRMALVLITDTGEKGAIPAAFRDEPVARSGRDRADREHEEKYKGYNRAKHH